MKEANVLIDESLQTELVHRVMALDGREETLRLSNLHLESTIETLTEHTQVAPTQIREIANELARASAISGSGPVAQNKARSLTLPVLASVGIGLVAIVSVSVLVGKSFSVSKPTDVAQFTPADITSDAVLPKANSYEIDVNGIFLKKAMLGSAFVDFSAVRNLVMMHYYDTGEFPNNLAELGLESDSMVSSNVRGLQVKQGGGVVVLLSEKMGDNTHVNMTPKLVMGGHSVEWSCTSNLPAAVLSGTPCEKT